MRRLQFAPRRPRRTGERRVVELLDAQLGAAICGARLARQTSSGAVCTAEARTAMNDVEMRGDGHRRELVDALGVTFVVTSVDREDIYRISRSADDVLDGLRDFVREADLFAVSDFSSCGDILTDVVAGLERLREALRATASGGSAEALDRARAAKKACNAIRRGYQEQLALVLSADVTSEHLKQRELLRRLDIVGLRLGEAADALSDGVMKRWH